MKSEKGMTLIELMVVVALLSILAGAMINGMQGMIIKAKHRQIMTNRSMITRAFHLVYADSGAWPNVNGVDAWSCLGPLGVTCWGGTHVSRALVNNAIDPYLNRIPRPGISSDYQGDYFEYSSHGITGTQTDDGGPYIKWPLIKASNVKVTDCPGILDTTTDPNYAYCYEHIGT